MANSVHQLVSDAITDSKLHSGRTTRIYGHEIKQAGASRDAVTSELYEACESADDTGRWYEFSGKDVDDREWSVHVDMMT